MHEVCKYFSLVFVSEKSQNNKSILLFLKNYTVQCRRSHRTHIHLYKHIRTLSLLWASWHILEIEEVPCYWRQHCLSSKARALLNPRSHHVRCHAATSCATGSGEMISFLWAAWPAGLAMASQSLVQMIQIIQVTVLDCAWPRRAMLRWERVWFPIPCTRMW